VERRLELLLGGGDVAEVRTLAHEAEALIARLELAEHDRSAELDALAELAAQVVPLEHEACAALARADAG